MEKTFADTLFEHRTRNRTSGLRIKQKDMVDILNSQLNSEILKITVQKYSIWETGKAVPSKAVREAVTRALRTVTKKGKA